MPIGPPRSSETGRGVPRENECQRLYSLVSPRRKPPTSSLSVEKAIHGPCPRMRAASSPLERYLKKPRFLGWRIRRIVRRQTISTVCELRGCRIQPPLPSSVFYPPSPPTAGTDSPQTGGCRSHAVNTTDSSHDDFRTFTTLFDPSRGPSLPHEHCLTNFTRAAHSTAPAAAHLSSAAGVWYNPADCGFDGSRAAQSYVSAASSFPGSSRIPRVY